MIIAIDGPSGAGKSTVAKMLSKKLGFEFIDTGAMYRAIAYKFDKNNIEIKEENIQAVLENTDIDYNNNNVYLDGENVEPFIRTENLSKKASEISKIQSVRDKLVNIQRNIACKKNIVMDGRDITTVVFPNAEYKFFITASAETRARRRYEELIKKGYCVSLQNVIDDINKRDYNDTTRKNSPLIVADDALVVDTTELDINEVVEKIVNIIKEK
ncbi:(d)CMP kinase [Sedimentibacter sp. zth1]|uniref:(d)CMP kinase n=1 Tax=Sedimentibacter sp. zth1 TaxID=2816908 RepID=UPI001A9203AA|nr:(d)CMP kinase [Sedimentibacter sp. zth1]QSX06787.1 (d)CMP kinase [Sedimentibacter sp. zth1]